MKKLLTTMLIACAGVASASIIYNVDVGGGSLTKNAENDDSWTSVIGTTNDTWNLTSSIGTTSNLQDANGNASTIGFTTAGGSYYANNTLADQGFQYGVWGAAIRVDTETGTFEITGLDQTKTYNLVIYNGLSRYASDMGTDYTIGGVTKSASETYEMPGFASEVGEGVTHVLFSNLSADGNNKIAGTYVKASGAVRGTISGIQLEVIPEPATLGLLGVAGFGLFFARRKKKFK